MRAGQVSKAAQNVCDIIHSPPAPGLALVFDMDGVIIHSNPVHARAWQIYNSRFGIETDEAMLERDLWANVPKAVWMTVERDMYTYARDQLCAYWAETA